MILHLLITVWVILCATANAAPQGSDISTFEPTVTIFAPCPVDSATREVSANALSSTNTDTPYPTVVSSLEAASLVPTDTTSHVAPTANSISIIAPGVSLSAGIGSVHSSKSTGIIKSVQTTSDQSFAFMVISGATSWLNGQTPTNAAQSFVVVTSAITVLPLSTAPPPPPGKSTMASRETVVVSTVTVIPLSTPRKASSEPVVVLTETVIPLSTVPLPLSLTSASASSNEPVVSTVTVVPLKATSGPVSSSTFSTSTSTSTSIGKSAEKSSIFPTTVGGNETSVLISGTGFSISVGIQASSISSSGLGGITLPTSFLTTVRGNETSVLISATGFSSSIGIQATSSRTGVITLPKSSQASVTIGISSNVPSASLSAGSTFGLVSSSTESITSIVSGSALASASKPVLTTNTGSSISSSNSSVLLVSSSTISKPVSVPANSTASMISSSAISESATIIPSKSIPIYTSSPTTTKVYTSATASTLNNAPPTKTGRIYTSAAGGWNASSSSTSESSFDIYTSFTLGSLTTLTAAGGFQSYATTSSFPILNATAVSSTASISSVIALSDATSLTKSVPLFDATSTTKLISLFSPTSVSGLITITKTTSISSSISLANATLTTKSMSLYGSASTPSLIPLSNTSSMSMSSSISNANSMSHSIPLSTAALSSGFVSVTLGSSSVTFPNSTSATTTSAAASTSNSDCGEHGDFVLTFDDVPPLSVSNASDTDVEPEPLFNPYHQFLFSDGFTVVPPPKRLPYLPSSSPLLLEFIPNFTANQSNRQTGPNSTEYGFSGQIGSGDEGFTGCFNFNLYGASLGCDSQGAACEFTFTGYRYDIASQQTSQVTQQVIAVPACPELSPCVLSSVDLDSRFTGLSYFVVNVRVAGQPKLWWMDDLRLGWFENGCAVGRCRRSEYVRLR